MVFLKKFMVTSQYDHGPTLVNSNPYSLNFEHVSNIEIIQQYNPAINPAVVGKTTSPGLFKRFLYESIDNLYNLYVHCQTQI